MAEVPSKLGRYEIVKHLANGGMAQVLIARATGIEGFERHVVVKRIHSDRAADPAFVQMFLDEARTAAALHHNNIVQVHDIGKENGEYFFAMEYVHGQDLRMLLKEAARKREKVPWEHIVTIMTAAAAGLHHAHELRGPDRKLIGLVHRDVSPANILIGYDGNVKVVDFGIAKAALRTGEGTRGGALKGKVSYMAPEQCAGKPIDRRSDVYALGVVLYELSTVRRLFKGENEFLTMSAIVAGNIPHPAKQRPDTPPVIADIIFKALARRPADRFQTADEMREALEQAANELKLRTSTGALASYMKYMFGAQPEPWLVDEDIELELTVDFDGSASGMAVATEDAEQNLSIPDSIEASMSAPIHHARRRITDAPPNVQLAAIGSQPNVKRATGTDGQGASTPRPRTPSQVAASLPAVAVPRKTPTSITKPSVIPAKTQTPPVGTPVARTNTPPVGAPETSRTNTPPVGAPAAIAHAKSTSIAMIPAKPQMPPAGIPVAKAPPPPFKSVTPPAGSPIVKKPATPPAGSPIVKKATPPAGSPIVKATPSAGTPVVKKATPPAGIPTIKPSSKATPPAGISTDAAKAEVKVDTTKTGPTALLDRAATPGRLPSLAEDDWLTGENRAIVDAKTDAPSKDSRAETQIPIDIDDVETVLVITKAESEAEKPAAPTAIEVTNAKSEEPADPAVATEPAALPSAPDPRKRLAIIAGAAALAIILIIVLATRGGSIQEQPKPNPPTPDRVEPKREPVAKEPVVKEPVKEPVAEPVKEPVKEPVAKPVAEPATEPVKEPVKEPVTQPVKEPVKEPVGVGSGSAKKRPPPPPKKKWNPDELFIQ